ncbi:C-C motif chemokine 3-like 1 [Colossoma macropomum]|uniref:C-C motif chemokine 3-like 1 n=1 Tax=Colossoma macropomum TaxID=42526 RepID=UPI001863E54B|nr:C-C motif chemokine 3-like 1 [Colossoma macropomum]XP_036423662.1 C-C motif chemokine 3-like 1 [Colossoma macropomum]
MRILSALLVLLLLCSLQLTSSAPAELSSDCCTKLTKMKIPLVFVESYWKTSSNCPLKAIVFLTKKGNKICVDPDAVWVSSHVATVDKRTGNDMTARTSTTTPKMLSLTKLP